ncbi:PKD domain-containing protein [bacterium]|nr:PKD domain-containing protein [bacterium]
MCGRASFFRILFFITLIFSASTLVEAADSNLINVQTRYADGGIPAEVGFTAFISGRNTEVLTELSEGCSYNASTGIVNIECAGFLSDWIDGEVLNIAFSDGDNFTGTLKLPLFSDAGTLPGYVILSNPAHQARLRIGDSAIVQGKSSEIPIYLDGIAPEDSVIAYELTLSYDSSLLSGIGAEAQMTMTELWGVPLFVNRQSEMVIGAFTTNQPGSELVSDNGILVKAKMFLDALPDDSSPPYTTIHIVRASIFTLTETIRISHFQSGLLEVSGIYADPGGPYTGIEGTAVTFDASNSIGAITYGWDFGDGATGQGIAPSHIYNDNGVYTLMLTAYDKNGLAGQPATTIVTVSNVAPVVDAGDDISGNEGESLSFGGNFTDAGNGDTHSFIWDFGDGHTAMGLNVSHSYVQNGMYSAKLTVEDDDGGIASDMIAVSVNNVSPIADAGGPYYSVTGMEIQFSGSVIDPGAADTHTYKWDLNNDGRYDDHAGQYPLMTYSELGSYRIGLRVMDTDGATDVDDAIVTITEGIEITITTNFPEESMIALVNGEVYSLPRTFSFSPGQKIRLEAPLDQTIDAGSRYKYSSWAEGGNRIKEITVPDIKTTYTANYQLQYFVDIKTGDVPTEIFGEGWYYIGDIADISVESDVIRVEKESRYTFSSWTGSGDGSYTGSQRTISITVDSPIIQSVSWNTEYYLQIATAYGIASGQGWYAPGTEVAIEVSDQAASGLMTRQVFTGWYGIGEGAYTGPDNIVNVTVNGPLTQIVAWQTQHRIDVISEYNIPLGAGWYPVGTVVQVSIDISMSSEDGTRINFIRWLGSGEGAYTGQDASFSLTVQGGITQQAEWQTEYYCDIISDHGDPAGSGWYHRNQLITLSVDEFVDLGQGSRMRFDGWAGSGDGSYSGTDRSGEIIIQGPVTEQVMWQQQYYITTSYIPSGGGVIKEYPAPGGWGDADTDITVTALGNAESNYGFSEWSGDLDGYVNPGQLLLNGPKTVIASFAQGNLHVLTDPPGLQLAIDGVQVIAPFVADWSVGEVHNIAAITPQGDQIAEKYDFNVWSDEGAVAHDVTISNIEAVYTASFDASYFIKVESDFGSAQGQGWYLPGSTAHLSVDDVVVESDLLRHRFTGWTGIGPGSISSAQREIDISVQGAITQKAAWDYEFKLATELYPAGTPGINITAYPSGPWYAPGTSVLLTIESESPDVQFTGWSGDIQSDNQTIQVIMNGPVSVRANFYLPNMPPYFEAIPLLHIVEDMPFVRSFDWLAQYVKDPNDGINELQIDIKGNSEVDASIDAARREVVLLPLPDWNGRTQLQMQVTDPQGEIAECIIDVNVVPVDDPPGAFELLEPPLDANFDEWSWTTAFKWQHSENVDPGDTLTYSFYFSPHASLRGEGTIAVAFLTDTTLLVSVKDPGTYYWGVWAEDKAGQKTRCNEIHSITLLTDVKIDNKTRPQQFVLHQNFPNPFNPITHIRYGVPHGGPVQLCVYDMLGRRTVMLFDGVVMPGMFEATWDGRDSMGNEVASGIYIVHMKAGDFQEQRKMLLLR